MTEELEFAAAFVRAIADGAAQAAHDMLSDDLRVATSATNLAAQFQSLADDMGGVNSIGTPMVILETWPGMSAHDRAMVYVPLEGDAYSEAMTVTVSSVDGALRISGVEWGRP